MLLSALEIKMSVAYKLGHTGSFNFLLLKGFLLFNRMIQISFNRMIQIVKMFFEILKLYQFLNF